MVVALGYGTTGFSIGDEVYGLTDWYRDGAAAGYVAVGARNLAPKPASLDHVHAAAVPLAALTAWQALFDHGGLSTGQSVLIHGAGGGVGVFAVQLAHSTGVHVVATGRAWGEDLVRELGADEFVDTERHRFEEVAGEVDVVFDLVGERSGSGPGQWSDREVCSSPLYPLPKRPGIREHAAPSSSSSPTGRSW